MWQQLIVGVLVLVAVVYAARKLGPRRWRAQGNAAASGGGCGCDNGKSPCQEIKKPGAIGG